MDNWHTGTVEETIKSLNTDKYNGLTSEQAQELLDINGKNEIKARKKQTAVQRFFAQMKDFLVVVLIFAALVSLVVEIVETKGHPNVAEPAIILAIVIINAVIGVLREKQAEAALEKLKELNSFSSDVIRDGQVVTISSEYIVPGDIVLLQAGNRIPADGRLIECQSLKCDESSLTDDDLPVEKTAESSLDVTAMLSARENMVHSGCYVVEGSAKYVVTATGMKSETGRIAGMLANDEDITTPLQKKLSGFEKKLGFIIIGICVFFFIFGAAHLDKSKPEGWVDVFTTAVALAVAAIPESLAAIVTAVMAVGIGETIEKGIIIKRISAMETIGSTTVICADKTGTLTSNEVSLVSVWAHTDISPCVLSVSAPSGEALRLMQLAALCSNATVKKEDNGMLSCSGEPTESAVVAALLNFGQTKETLESSCIRIAELPFDADRGLMTTIHRAGDKIIAITKGSPDALLQKCHKADIHKINEICKKMEHDSLKVIAVACRELNELPDAPICEDIEKGLTFFGLISMMNPPEENARAAVKQCDGAGIRTIMITGEHLAAATAAAEELGIITKGDESITGEQLDNMSDDELFNSIRRYSLYAETTPKDKTRIVEAWQKAGEVVAVTGSGVDDAAALRAANTGCAMGNNSTDIAKGMSNLTITDNNYLSIANAVKYSRGIYDNIRKSLQYLLSCNLGEMMTVFFCMIIFNVSPLAAMHLLLINLITDSFPALALSVEPYERDIMSRRPRSNTNLYDKPALFHTILFGSVIGIVSIIAYALGNVSGIDGVAQTMCFGTLALSQLLHVLNVRSHRSIFEEGFFANRQIFIAEGISLFVTLFVMIAPKLNVKVFKLVPLSGSAWFTIILLSVVPVVVSELVKLTTELLRKNRIVE